MSAALGRLRQAHAVLAGSEGAKYRTGGAA